jgi:hypothetical protein
MTRKNQPAAIASAALMVPGIGWLLGALEVNEKTNISVVAGAFGVRVSSIDLYFLSREYRIPGWQGNKYRGWERRGPAHPY